MQQLSSQSFFLEDNPQQVPQENALLVISLLALY